LGEDATLLRNDALVGVIDGVLDVLDGDREEAESVTHDFDVIGSENGGRSGRWADAAVVRGPVSVVGRQGRPRALYDVMVRDGLPSPCSSSRYSTLPTPARRPRHCHYQQPPGQPRPGLDEGSRHRYAEAVRAGYAHHGEGALLAAAPTALATAGLCHRSGPVSPPAPFLRPTRPSATLRSPPRSLTPTPNYRRNLGRRGDQSRPRRRHDPLRG
jgi:hypothetical protein